MFVGIANAERTASPAAMARRRTEQFNILCFSPLPSHPSGHGEGASIQEFRRRFQSMGHKVFLVVLNSQIGEVATVAQTHLPWDGIDILQFENPLVDGDNPIPFDPWNEERFGEKIHTICAKYGIDVVFFSRLVRYRLLDFVPRHVLKVITTSEEMFDRFDILCAHRQSPEFFSCLPEEGGADLRRADIVVARRQEEADYLNAVTGLATAIVAPHVEPDDQGEESLKRMFKHPKLSAPGQPGDGVGYGASC
jgi:hypothetical protein